MPIYEYRCLACDNVSEAIQKFSDAPLKKCALCGGKLEKLISRTAFVLKGGGWYNEGYGNKAKGGSGAADKAESAGKTEKGEKAETSGKGESASSGSKSAGAAGGETGKGEGKKKSPGGAGGKSST